MVGGLFAVARFAGRGAHEDEHIADHDVVIGAEVLRELNKVNVGVEHVSSTWQHDMVYESPRVAVVAGRESSNSGPGGVGGAEGRFHVEFISAEGERGFGLAEDVAPYVIHVQVRYGILVVSCHADETTCRVGGYLSDVSLKVSSSRSLGQSVGDAAMVVRVQADKGVPGLVVDCERPTSGVGHRGPCGKLEPDAGADEPEHLSGDDGHVSHALGGLYELDALFIHGVTLQVMFLYCSHVNLRTSEVRGEGPRIIVAVAIVRCNTHDPWRFHDRRVCHRCLRGGRGRSGWSRRGQCWCCLGLDRCGATWYWVGDRLSVGQRSAWRGSRGPWCRLHCHCLWPNRAGRRGHTQPAGDSVGGEFRDELMSLGRACYREGTYVFRSSAYC